MQWLFHWILKVRRTGYHGCPTIFTGASFFLEYLFFLWMWLTGQDRLIIELSECIKFSFPMTTSHKKLFRSNLCSNALHVPNNWTPLRFVKIRPICRPFGSFSKHVGSVSLSTDSLLRPFWKEIFPFSHRLKNIWVFYGIIFWRKCSKFSGITIQSMRNRMLCFIFL